jgi:hypothetical protein
VNEITMLKFFCRQERTSARQACRK